MSGGLCSDAVCGQVDSGAPSMDMVSIPVVFLLSECPQKKGINVILSGRAQTTRFRFYDA